MGWGRGTSFNVAHAVGGKATKLELRRAVVEALGVPAHVFEAYAGVGLIWRALWKDAAASYIGCDLKWYRDAGRRFVCDNRRLLRCLDLTPFNVFDLDAYGSPWEQALIISARRKLVAGERIAIVVTESGLSYRSGIVPRPITELIGLQHRVIADASLNHARSDVQQKIWRALAQRMGGEVSRLWRAEANTGKSDMNYLGAIFVSAVVDQQAAA